MTDTATDKPALRKPEFVKIKDLERGRSGYNVYVKVVKCEERSVDTRDGQKIKMIEAIVADETGSSNAFFKGEHAKDIKEGVTIAIRNGVKKIIKGHISLELDLFGRVTLENVNIAPSSELNISTEEIKFEPRRNTGNRNNNNRNYNRGGQRNFSKNRDNRERPERRDNRDNRERPERRDNRRNDEVGGERRVRNNDRDYDRRNNNRDYDRRDNNRSEGRGYTEKPRNENRFQEKRGERRPMIKIN